MNVKEGLLLESFLDALRFIKKVDLGISVNDYAANKYFYRDAWEENEDFFRYAYELKEKQLQAAEEREKILREAVEFYASEFKEMTLDGFNNDFYYGKARQALEKVKGES